MRAHLDNPVIAQALVSSAGKTICKVSVGSSYTRPWLVARKLQSSTLRPRGCFWGFDDTRVSRVVDVRSMADRAAEKEGSAESKDTILQYIVLRKDLYQTMSWPLGSVIAQACHAATAALWESRNEDMTLEYTDGDQLNHMHKVVLEAKGETQLRNLSSKLEEAGIRHKLWMEQPENVPTCLAAAPYRKSIVQAFFKKYKLCGS